MSEAGAKHCRELAEQYGIPPNEECFLSPLLRGASVELPDFTPFSVHSAKKEEDTVDQKLQEVFLPARQLLGKIAAVRARSELEETAKYSRVVPGGQLVRSAVNPSKSRRIVTGVVRDIVVQLVNEESLSETSRKAFSRRADSISRLFGIATTTIVRGSGTKEYYRYSAFYLDLHSDPPADHYALRCRVMPEVATFSPPDATIL